MRVLSYEDWFDKIGSDYASFIENWLEKRPLGISLQSLGIYDLSDFVNEKILEAYEDYISDFEDRAYDEYKDSRCF